MGPSECPAAGNGSRFEGLLYLVDDVVWFASADGQRMLYINPAAERLCVSSQPGRVVERARRRAAVAHHREIEDRQGDHEVAP